MTHEQIPSDYPDQLRKPLEALIKAAESSEMTVKYLQEATEALLDLVK